MTEEGTSPLRALLGEMPQVGRVTWIGVRPAREEPLISMESTAATEAGGLDGDRFDGGRTGRRQVTLIQAEHLQAVASILNRADIDPGLTRRNLVVAGINLRALMKARFRVGLVVLEGTYECAPCSRMEQNLGRGGYNAMLGHGGICAKIVSGGIIRLGDPVHFDSLLDRQPDDDD